ncbi:bi-functional transferase/deacetylase, partial [Streptomyces sp. NPDC055692]
MYLVVIQSVFTAVSGSRLRWQRMERYGSLQAPAGTEAPRKDLTPQEPGFPQPAPYDALQQQAPYNGLPQPPPHNGFRQPAPHETPQWY